MRLLIRLVFFYRLSQLHTLKAWPYAGRSEGLRALRGVRFDVTSAGVPRHATKAMKRFREVERDIVRVRYHRDSGDLSRSRAFRRADEILPTRQSLRYLPRGQTRRYEGRTARGRHY